MLLLVLLLVLPVLLLVMLMVPLPLLRTAVLLLVRMPVLWPVLRSVLHFLLPGLLLLRLLRLSPMPTATAPYRDPSSWVLRLLPMWGSPSLVLRPLLVVLLPMLLLVLVLAELRHALFLVLLSHLPVILQAVLQSRSVPLLLVVFPLPVLLVLLPLPVALVMHSLPMALVLPALPAVSWPTAALPGTSLLAGPRCCLVAASVPELPLLILLLLPSHGPEAS
jgi:hypothetical protein